MTDHSRRYTAEYWDHRRGLEKHWTPDVPIRLEPGPHSTAMDIALIVQRTTNLVEGGKLIEQYAKTQIARAALDATLDRIAGSTRKRLIVAKLIGTCEGLCGSGMLGDGEADTRELIAEALSAFGMTAANREERETV